MNSFSTQIAAIAFDMDGLMLNTEDLYGEVGEILMGRRKKSYRKDVREQMIGLPAQQAFGVLIEAEGLLDTWEDLQKEADEIFEELLPEKLALMPGLIELLNAVEANDLRCCVATSSTRSFATKALSHTGVLERFDFILTAGDVPRGKPYPDIYLEAARRMEVSAETMLVLEDSPHGTTAGVAAGAFVVSVPNAHTRNGNFHGARWISDSLCDERLHRLIQNRPSIERTATRRPHG
jgi:HAD superfamily hydrolase (TIGR01509 family)